MLTNICYYRVLGTACSTNVAVSVTPLANVNQDIDSTQPNQDDKCDTCGQFPHPVQSIRKLAPELQLAFPVPGAHGDTATGQHKRRKVQVTARYISGDEMYTQLKEKAEATCSIKPKCNFKKKPICKPPKKVVEKVAKMDKQNHDSKSSITPTSTDEPKTIGMCTTLTKQYIPINYLITKYD